MIRSVLWLALSLTLVGSTASLEPAGAQSVCGTYDVLGHQAQNTATIARLEAAWTAAFLRGDTSFERCLLLPSYTEIRRDGKVANLADELALAHSNAGKHRSAGPAPRETIIIHRDVAVAYGSSRLGNSATDMVTFADYYTWDGNDWRVYFAQQTAWHT